MCDPFAGTSTFLVRLLQSGLIKPEDLARKYAGELFATEIMLLAYYVSAVNIETTYNALIADQAHKQGLPRPEYVPFDGIALADTFQITEDGDLPNLEVFKNNNERIERQKAAPINVNIGNPPYSSGQKSANDLNANLKYPTLDQRIADTYVAKSTSTNKNSLYESYLRAFRWATDRIGDAGVVAFVSNGGWIDGNSSAGVRLAMQDDFTDLYVFNLRGNMRNSDWKAEGGQVFGAGSQTTVAILIGIKDPNKSGFALHYTQTPDGATRDEKLGIAKQGSISSLPWQTITPNQHGDWLNQRNEEFEIWPALGDKSKNSTDPTFFEVFSSGLKTGRDSWAYARTPELLLSQMETLAENYNTARKEFHLWATAQGITNPKEADVTAFLQKHPEWTDSKKMSWNVEFKKLAAKDRPLSAEPERIYVSTYRPFTSMFAYFQSEFNDRVYQLPSIFPTPTHSNVGIVVMSPRSTATFATIAVNQIPDVATFTYTTQLFSRLTWKNNGNVTSTLFDADATQSSDGETSIYGKIGEQIGNFTRIDNITPEIKAIYLNALGDDITGDDIFHFVYGKLHDPTYRTEFVGDLKKVLPRIKTPETREEFDRFAAAGAKLIALHTEYESLEPWPLDIAVKGDENDRETWRVLKMAWVKKTDPETGKKVADHTRLIYNKKVTISGIPEDADRYQLGTRSAVGWLIDRYLVKKDRASQIVNDPNDWADEVGNPRYIVDLIGKVVRVAMETNKIVDTL